MSCIILPITEYDILLSEIGEVLHSRIHIPALETTGNLAVKERIYRGASVLIYKVAVGILEVCHEVIYPA